LVTLFRIGMTQRLEEIWNLRKPATAKLERLPTELQVAGDD
jgi:hypothetical protein